MSDIKIIKDRSCKKCLGQLGVVSYSGGVEGGRLIRSTIGKCIKCGYQDIFSDHFEAEFLKDKAEAKSEAIKSEERPSKYHLLNTFSHKKYFDWYDVERAKRATDIVIDPAIEHASKKLFVNDRGHKDELTDIEEAIWSLQNAREEILRLRELKNNESN